ncbi:SAM-dependent methyltransferase [Pseudonocardia sp. TMWB2A]|uniref:class I SAM-dependent methyltransferase n=1 Tax=Pseudonocardia sp. TMWB2A TaxID=687430 RepID=UPI00307E7D53
METDRADGSAVRRPDFGIDAPYVPAGYLAGAVVAAVPAVLFGPLWWITAAFFLLGAGIYLHTTRRGKFVAWERLLDRAAIAEDARVLDVGCGRGAVTVAVARRVPRGRVAGVDLWRRGDQSGNDPATTRANLEAAGVAERVELHTADMRDLPFPDASFDLVVSSLAVHNLPRSEDRDRAVDEMCRVLRPDGRLVVADLGRTARYAERIRARRPSATVTRTRLGPIMWWSWPWGGTSVVVAGPSGE